MDNRITVHIEIKISIASVRNNKTNNRRSKEVHLTEEGQFQDKYQMEMSGKGITRSRLRKKYSNESSVKEILRTMEGDNTRND